MLNLKLNKKYIGVDPFNQSGGKLGTFLFSISRKMGTDFIKERWQHAIKCYAYRDFEIYDSEGTELSDDEMRKTIISLYFK